MRIGYIVADFPPLSETFVRREVLGLCDAGHRLFVYTRRRHFDPLVPEPSHAMLQVRETGVFEDLVAAARGDRVEHLHGSLMLLAQQAAHAASQALELPFSIRVYSGHDVFTAGDPSLYTALSRDPLCTGVIVEDPFMRDWVVERLGAAPEKVRVAGNPVDLERYRISKPRPRRKTVRILSIARFVEKKGLVHLVEAFQILCRRRQNAELWLIGAGPEEERLRHAAGSNPSVRFLGLVPESRCREAYFEADIFCLPCVRAADGDADGIPTVVLEAMACELPVVASNLLSAPCYVRDGCEGLLTEPGDAAGIAECLERLCARPAVRRRMGRAGRLRVEELCDIRRNVRQLEAVFRGERPLVGIAITAYNREKYLAQAIDSALSQTYSPIEVVVVDDGSSDGTPALLERYGGRIRVARHERNAGMAAAKNRALRMTPESARYVAMLDSDDYFDPQFVERCVNRLEAIPPAGLVYVDAVGVDETGRELWRQPGLEPWDTETWLRTRALTGDCWMARRDLVVKTQPLDSRTDPDSDHDLLYQLLETTAFAHVPGGLLHYREHPAQASNNALEMARAHAANLVRYGYSPEYAYLRARRNPEMVPAIEAGIALGREMRAERAAAAGAPIRSSFLPFGAPFLGEEEIAEVVATIRSGWIGPGPRVEAFEKEFAAYAGAGEAVALNSCTAGLFLALISLGVGPGDEVITTPFTFAATANAIEHTGARPVFVDIHPETLNLDPARIERAITPRTRVILPVHFGGLPCEMDSIGSLAEKHGLSVIEDAAHATGARYGGRMIGGLGNPAAFSFYANQSLTTAQGGMVALDDPALAERLRLLRLHGLDAGPWQRFATRSVANPEVLLPGFGFAMPDLAAALGLPQLRKQEAFLAARERYARSYDEAFADLPFHRQRRPADTDRNRHSLHLYVLLLQEGRWRIGRDEVVRALLADNIGAAVHYRPLHTHAFYRSKYGFAPADYPEAARAGDSILTLPLSAAMTDADAGDVIAAVRKVAARGAR